jgi:hypothetical protein
LKFSALVVVLLAAELLLLASGAQVFADPLKNASHQRIGNYDMQLATDPKNPVVGNPTRMQIRIAGVNGDDLVNVPIQIRLVDGQNRVLQYSSTITVPAGHYFYDYTFPEPGRYVMYVDLKDTSYSNSILTFTFFVNVAGPFDYYLYVVVPFVAVVAIGVAGMLVFMKKRKKNQILK